MFGPNTLRNLNRAMTRQRENVGPFVVQEVAGAGDAPYFVAIDPESGLMFEGTATKDASVEVARILNAAYRLGHTRGKADR